MMTPQFDFDARIERRSTQSVKWSVFAEDVLPLWVADMDFQSPPPVIEALRARVEHGIFGYQMDDPALRAVLVERLRTLHGIDAQPGDIVFVPGLGVGLNVAAKAYGGEPGSAIMLNTPIYRPFIMAVEQAQRTLIDVPLACAERDGALHYTMDFDAMEAAVTPQTRTFMLCNPQNPTGRAFTRAELEQLADFARRHDLVVVSDEIHCDLPMTDAPPVSFAGLGPDAAARTVTLFAPSKTYNVPGLGLGFAVITDPALRAQYAHLVENTALHVTGMGYVGALAAYRDGEAWRAEVLAYLRANRDYAVAYLREHLPQLRFTVPEATYLLWIDCRAAGIPGEPAAWLLEKARVALNNGDWFGAAGDGFVRLNFACPRSVLAEALERIRAAIEDLPG